LEGFWMNRGGRLHKPELVHVKEKKRSIEKRKASRNHPQE